MDIRVSKASLGEEALGQIHQAFGAAEIDLPILATQVAGFPGLVGGDDIKREGAIACLQGQQFLPGNNVITGSDEIQQSHRCPVILGRHGLKLAQHWRDAAATGNKQHRLGRFWYQKITKGFAQTDYRPSLQVIVKPVGHQAAGKAFDGQRDQSLFLPEQG